MAVRGRPKIKLKSTLTDKLLELLAGLLLLVIWGYALLNYTNLPETIPTHYGFDGTANSFGSKQTLLTIPIITTLIFVFLTLLNRHPYTFNYPVKITEENALRQYANATRMMRVLNLSVTFVFGLLLYETITNANQETPSLHTWFLPLTLGLTFIPLTFFIIRAVKMK